LNWGLSLFGPGRVSTMEFKPDPNYCSDPSESGAVPFQLHNRLPDSGRIRTTDRIRPKLLRAGLGSGSALSCSGDFKWLYLGRWSCVGRTRVHAAAAPASAAAAGVASPSAAPAASCASRVATAPAPPAAAEVVVARRVGLVAGSRNWARWREVSVHQALPLNSGLRILKRSSPYITVFPYKSSLCC
jgi:hypothetical protein